MREKLGKAKEFLHKYGQDHLLAFFEELDKTGQDELLGQIFSLDFELVEGLYGSLAGNSAKKSFPPDLKPIKSQDWNSLSQEDKARHYNTGIDALKSGAVGVVLVAGGQGSRLGFNGPKGTFKLDIPSDKSLFQIQCERLANLSKQAGKYIPWYIMTSSENNQDTIEYFKDNDYFGYPSDYIRFFIQDSLPVVDEKGKVLLAEKGRISMGPNGNGGCFAAMDKSGVLKDMKSKGVEWIFLCGVDNVLTKVADPGFVGFTINSGMKASSKVVKKVKPEEKIAVFCYYEGKPYLIEYSELPPELMYKREENGELTFDDGSIAIHLFSRDFLENHAQSGLPYHVAHKKIPFVDPQGNIIRPETPNAYKFEMFMFDIFTFFPDLVTFKVAREEDFAPVKNAEGEDSPASAKELLLGLHRKWLLEAGVSEALLKGREVEVSPLTSYGGEGLNAEEIITKLGNNKSKVEL